MKPAVPSSRGVAAPPNRGAKSIDVLAAHWVMRHDAGLTAAERDELAAWLAFDSAHAKAFARLTAMSNALARAHSNCAAVEVIAQLEVRARQRRSRRRAFAGVAGVVAIAFALSFLTRAPHQSHGANATKTFEPSRRLPDGSVVELKHGSEIAVRFDGEAREVDLIRGEGLFRVERDAARPFVVRAASINVQAIGTEFSVRIDPAEIQVLVTHGIVGLQDGARRESLLPVRTDHEVPGLVPGQMAVVTLPGPHDGRPLVRVIEVGPAEVKTHLAWRRPRFEFDRVELASAVAQFNRENRVQLVIDGDALRNLRISGSFVPNDPRTFARLVAATCDLEIEGRSADELILRKK